MFRPAAWLCAVTLFAVTLFAGAATPACAQAPLTGAGASFPAPVYERWAADYLARTGRRVVFEAIGSGRGVERFESGLVDFGASDRPLDASELSRLDAFQFPVLVGGVVPVFNLRGAAPGALKLTGTVLARIYLGDIRAWNDPALVALNPGLDLPSENITVVRRADISGTRFLWNDFLGRKSPEWRARVERGSEVDRPVGVTASGNEEVASLVQRTRAALGYVEYAYARQHGLSDASLDNRAGRFVKASQAAFAASAASASWRTQADLVQVLVDAEGPESWPITGSTFVILHRHPADPERQRALMEFFRWGLAQGRAEVRDLGYVPMPAPAVELTEAAWQEAARLTEVGGRGP